jgi:PTS system nitrogen regulatory IIA component
MFHILHVPSIILAIGVEEAVFSDLDASDKSSAVRFMVRTLVEKNGIASTEIIPLTRAILGREELGSTGIGQGVAAPHTRHPCVRRLILGWFFADPAIDFEALDGEPVDVFMCLISPPNQPGDHLRCLEAVSLLLKEEHFVSIYRNGISCFKEWFYIIKSCGGIWVPGIWPGTREHYQALGIEGELTRIGVGLNHLRMEGASLWQVACEAGWDRTEAELIRIEASLERLEARLSEVGPAAFKEGSDRLVQMRGGLRSKAAEAKCGGLRVAIMESTDCRLDSLTVGVNGRHVSIRGRAGCDRRLEDLRHSIASLPGLDGFRTEILIEAVPEAEAGSLNHHEPATTNEERRLVEAERHRLKCAIRKALGRRLLSLTIEVEGRSVSIGAKASHFWQRRKLRRTIESLPCLADYHIDLEVD